MKLFSTDFIVLTSSEAISDLLEKRSSIYSDRVRHFLIPVACSFLLTYNQPTIPMLELCVVRDARI